MFSFFGREILPSQSHPIWRRVGINPQTPHQSENDVSPAPDDPHPPGTQDRNEYSRWDSEIADDMVLDHPNLT